jgi:hypothetical protein
LSAFSFADTFKLKTKIIRDNKNVGYCFIVKNPFLEDKKPSTKMLWKRAVITV